MTDQNDPLSLKPNPDNFVDNVCVCYVYVFVFLAFYIIDYILNMDSSHYIHSDVFLYSSSPYWRTW